MLRMIKIGLLVSLVCSSNMLAQTVIITDTGNWAGKIHCEYSSEPKRIYWKQTGANPVDEYHGGSCFEKMEVKAFGHNTIQNRLTYWLAPDRVTTMDVITAPEIIGYIDVSKPQEETLSGWRLAASRQATQDNVKVKPPILAPDYPIPLKAIQMSCDAGYTASPTVIAAARKALTGNPGLQINHGISMSVAPITLERQGDVLRVEYQIKAQVQRVRVLAYPDQNRDGVADGPPVVFVMTARESPAFHYRTVKETKDGEPGT